VKTPKEVMRLWNEIPTKDRNSRVSREFSAMCGMKSMAEVETAALFDEHGIKYGYETETWDYQYEPQKYTPDFNTDNEIHVEVKGKATKETRKKMLAVQRDNPGKVIVLRFLRGINKIAKNSKTTYLGWFRKKGFICFDWKEEEEFLKFIKSKKKGIRSKL